MMNEWDASARITDDSKNDTQITQVPISKLHPFEGHPYKVLDDAEMDELTESIREHGILSPLLVRPLEGSPGEYEVISGHRRLHAARRTGLETVPAFIREIDRDAAAVELVDSNLHREHILPSEKAFAYRLKLEVLDRRGKRCGQVGHKSRDAVSDTESGRTVQRYIRLTYLSPELLDLVDKGRIAFSVGVELSYLDETAQAYIAEIAAREDVTPSYSQASRMHRIGVCTLEQIEAIMSEEKPNQRETVKIRADRLREVLPSGMAGEQAEEFILKPATITGSIFSASVTPDEGRDRDGKAEANGFPDRGRPRGDGFLFSGAESRHCGPSETDADLFLHRAQQICRFGQFLV